MKLPVILMLSGFGLYCSAQQPATVSSFDVNNIAVIENYPQPGSSQTPLIIPIKALSITTVASFDSVRYVTEINHPFTADAFPCLSPDGLRLYYTDEANGNQLYMATRPDQYSYFNTPVNVPLNVNGSSFWLSQDELDIYICGSELYQAHRTTVNDPFGAATVLSLGITVGSRRSASLDSAQNRLCIALFGSPYNGLYEFVRTSPTSFSLLRKVSVPSGYTMVTGQMSRDGLNIFIDGTTGSTISGPMYIYQMSRASLLDTFDIATFQQVPVVNAIAMRNVQASVSDNLDWMAFVRADSNMWSHNEIFLASKTGILTSAFQPEELSLSIYPSPASGPVHVIYDKPVASVTVIGADGKILPVTITPENGGLLINPRARASGIYFLTLTFADGSRLSKKIAFY